MSDYTVHPNGGVIGKQSKRCMQQFTVRGAGSYIEITQGTDQLLVSEAQLPMVLDAIATAAGYLKWKAPMSVTAPATELCDEIHPVWPLVTCAMPADHVLRGQAHVGGGYAWGGEGRW